MHSGRATYIQSQFPYSIGENYNVPKIIPGMMSGDDYVFFNIPQNFPEYYVLIGVLVGPSFNNSLGRLRPSVQLPNAQIDPSGYVTLIPRDRRNPIFMGRSRRGARYCIPHGWQHARPGDVLMLH